MEMEATDLMIGDWVLGFVEDDEEVGKIVGKHPAKIVKIEDNGDYSAQCHYTFDEMYDGDGHIIDDFYWAGCVPLPLTNEILNSIDEHPVKLGNGKLEWQYIIYYKGVDGYEDVKSQSIIIDEMGDGYYDLTAINHDSNIRVDMTVRYVHQLQHALKLCGIDKEITL